MSVESWARRERFWEKVTLWAKRHYQYAVHQRRLAQREAYLRTKAIERTERPIVTATDDEDEFFG